MQPNTLRVHTLSAVLLVSLLCLLCEADDVPTDGEREPASNPGDAACINKEYQYSPTTWNETFVHEAPARIFVQRKWVPTNTSPINLSIATHLTMGRLKQLEAQCTNWEGNLVAVVYMPVLQPGGHAWLGKRGQKVVSKVEGALNDFHKHAEASQPCKLTILLVWESFTQANISLLYPYNILRNTALMQVKTPLAAMLDVDLVPSASLAQDLKDPAKMQQLEQLCAQKVAVVLPALEIIPPAGADGGQLDDATLANMQARFLEAIKGGKSTVRGMWSTSSIRSFDAVNFPRGHNPTDYGYWLAHDEFYNINYSWEFEPWYIVDRRLNWWYDVRFRAYFYDKSIQLASMVKLGGFQLRGHPTAFLVHRPHIKPAIKSDPSIFANILRVMKPRAGLAWAEMWDGWYRVMVNKALKECLQAMPWWNIQVGDPEYWKWSMLFTSSTPFSPYV